MKQSAKRVNHHWTPADLLLLRELRQQRVPFAEIAERIGSTTSSCHQKASKAGINNGRKTCLTCGKRMTGQATLGSKRQYCSPRCGVLVRRARMTNERIDSRDHTHCLHCGARLIPPWSSKRKWCSRACGQRSWYERSYQHDPAKHIARIRRSQIRRGVVDEMTSREYGVLLQVRERGTASRYWIHKLREMLDLDSTWDLVRYARSIHI